MTRCESKREPALIRPTGHRDAPETFCTSGTSPTLHLIGLGAVGREFAGLACARGLRVIGATDSAARVFRRAGLDLEDLSDRKARGESLRQLPGAEPLPVELAIDLVEADVLVDAARAFCDGLSCFSLAESLGGVESLVAHPATMTYAAMSEEARVAAGIGPGWLRLSVGLEDPADPVADVRAGLRRASEEVGAYAAVGRT